MSTSRRWMFTTNNYSDACLAIFDSIPCKYICYGKEVAPTTGTPHLQGFVIFEKPRTLAGCRKLHGASDWSPSRTSSDACRKYCSKGLQSKEEWESLKDEGPNYGLDADVTERGNPPVFSGKRSDLDAVKEAIEGGASLQDIRKLHSSAFSRHRQWCVEYHNDCSPVPVIPDHPLRPWQKNLEEVLDGPIDDRSIYFIVDEDGNGGKSWFSEWYRQKHPRDTIKVRPGKKADMVAAATSYGFHPRVLILDAPRSKQSRKSGSDDVESALMYDFLEEMKDGEILSSKYGSYMWRFKKPHVVVMTNIEPDMAKLSLDRYRIITVSNSFNPEN